MTSAQKTQALVKYRRLQEHYSQLCAAARDHGDRHRHALEVVWDARARLSSLTINRGRSAAYRTGYDAERYVTEQQRVVDDAQAEAERLRLEGEALQVRASEASAVAVKCRDHLRGLDIPWQELE
jgi:hypothetical protein